MLGRPAYEKSYLYLVCGSGVASRELLGVEGETESSLDAGSESLRVTEREDTSVAHLRLDESSRVEVPEKTQLNKEPQSKIEKDLRLSANLDLNAVRAPVGVEDSLSTSLDVTAHAVVVAGAVAGEALASKECDGVFGCAEANTSRVLCDRAGADVVRCLRAEKETVMAENGVSSESRALQ